MGNLTTNRVYVYMHTHVCIYVLYINVVHALPDFLSHPPQYFLRFLNEHKVISEMRVPQYEPQKAIVLGLGPPKNGTPSYRKLLYNHGFRSLDYMTLNP